MKKILLIISIVFINSSCGTNKIYYQKFDILSQLNKITSIPYLPELSGDKIYWELVKKKLEVMDDLINELDNNTLTNINIPNYGGKYTIGDISFSIIQHIITNIPLKDIIPNYNESEKYYNYWLFIRKDKNNRKLFKQLFKQWYNLNKNNLEWITDNKQYKTSSDWPYKKKTHPAGGYYVVKTH